MKRNNKTRSIGSRLAKAAYAFLRFFIIFGVGFIILKPIIGKTLLSFMSPQDLLDNTVKLIPRNWSVHYWKAALEQMYLPKSLINTVLLSLSIALIQTFSCTLVGYGLARFKFKGRGLAFAFVVTILLVPYQVISIAQYQSFVNIHIGSWQIVDSFLPLYVLAFTGLGVKEGLYIYLMRENFRSLSVTLEEAAYIDGAGVFRTFATIMVPNARTMMITIFLFTFCWQWTDKTYTSLYLLDTKVFSNSLSKIYIENGNFGDPVGTAIAKCAGSLFVMAPLIILFVFCQKYFVKSISQAGLSSS
ncbi:MAG: carbohydrate ABC transporter permease [Acutalibacteraceae bacterium]